MTSAKSIDAAHTTSSGESLFSNEIKIQISELGLNLETLVAHANFIQSWATKSQLNLFRVVDTCRIDNTGIIPIASAHQITNLVPIPKAKNYIAFVPAAGAASRYTQPFSELLQLLEERSKREFEKSDYTEINKKLDELRRIGAKNWPLPRGLANLLEQLEVDSKSLNQELCKKISSELFLPKALYPCVMEQFTFLEIKDLEHRSYQHICGQVFVTPPSMARVFEMHLHSSRLLNSHSKLQMNLDSFFIEQGPHLSTIRFLPDGKPYLDSEGRISIVPAGHGALAELFFEMKRYFNQGHSLFIRNIDNVTGFSSEKISSTSSFLSIHEAILGILNHIRESLNTGNIAAAAKFAEPLMTLMTDQGTNINSHNLARLKNEMKPAEYTLWSILMQLFHTALPEKPTTETLCALFSRPFNLMGQVPNTHNDIGGTPCFTSRQNGVDKICIEVPHVSTSDRDKFFMDPEKATHFNPVFVAAEIPNEPGYYSKRSKDFGLLAQKSYKGTSVAYVETVLYELLGNSILANCIFVEIPRNLFNPHKVPRDAAQRSLDSWRK